MDEILATRYPEINAGGFSRVDGTIAFYQRVNSLLTPSMTVLDFGAGRGAFLDDPCEYRRRLRNLKGKVQEVIGVDIDEALHANRSLDRALVCKADGKIPLADEAVDLLLSDFTFEHLEFPDLVTREMNRVLKAGGWICARTTNRNGYIAWFNRLIHSRWHHLVLERLQPGRSHVDVFPAFYRLNTGAALRRCFSEDQYLHYIYTWDSEPRYFSNSVMLLRLFNCVHAMTPNRLKTTMMIFMKKREGLTERTQLRSANYNINVPSANFGE
jgi:SAM-dependent methyltransferase